LLLIDSGEINGLPMEMGSGEKQEKLRQNIYADFISVCVAALESGKLMTLIPKLFFL
jgi:hypothetical protein